MSSFFALLSALPQVTALFQLIADMVRDAEQRGLGRKEAIAEALMLAHRDIAYASAVEADAMSDHAKNKTDEAFDKSFERKDER